MNAGDELYALHNERIQEEQKRKAEQAGSRSCRVRLCRRERSGKTESSTSQRHNSQRQ